MTKTIEAPLKPINGPALAAELQAAAGDASQGYSVGSRWPGVIRLHFADGTAQGVIDAALAAYAAHDPDVLTPAQELAARRIAAPGALQTADFAALLTQINAASSLADAKPILRKLLALVYRVALAQGLTDAPDVEG